MTRREFLRGSAAGALATVGLPNLITTPALGAGGKAGANSRINIGMIGMGRQAYQRNLGPFLESPDTQVVAICDVDSWRAEQGRKKAEEFYAAQTRSGLYKGCAVYRDFREVLNRTDIDAVMISTPDHWHAYMAVEAAKAGKHVALEKPISLSIRQGRAIAEAMHKHQRIFRTDTEVRFTREFHRACEVVRNGRIGAVRRIFAGVPNEAAPVGVQASGPPPDELDYEMWLGPAPEAPYTEKRVHTHRNLSARPGWMIIQDYCDGIICNWGTHLIDIVQWGNNSERTGPVEIEGRGEFHPPGGLSNVLQGFEVRYAYRNGMELIYRMTGRPYVRFEGTDGWVEAVWGKSIEAHSKEILERPTGPDEIQLPFLSEKADFINAVKNQSETLIPSEIGHRTNSMCQLGLIAIQVGQKLQWDPAREQFIDNTKANQLLDRPLRAPWKIVV